MENLNKETLLGAAIGRAQSLLQQEKNRLDDAVRVRTVVEDLIVNLSEIRPLKLEFESLQKSRDDLTASCASLNSAVAKLAKDVTSKKHELAVLDSSIADRHEQLRSITERENAVAEREAAVASREKTLAAAAAMLGG